MRRVAIHTMDVVLCELRSKVHLFTEVCTDLDNWMAYEDPLFGWKRKCLRCRCKLHNDEKFCSTCEEFILDGFLDDMLHRLEPTWCGY